MKNLSKRGKIIIISLIVLIICLIPIPSGVKDGGTKEYNAILYKVTKVHSLNLHKKNNYDKGYKISILGIEVFNNVK